MIFLSYDMCVLFVDWMLVFDDVWLLYMLILLGSYDICVYMVDDLFVCM